MAKNITRWSPDTCGCIFEYEWDDSVAVDQRTHTIKAIISTCSDHIGMNSNIENHYDKILEENVCKNKVHGQLLTLTNIGENDIEGKLVPKKGVNVNFSFSGQGEDRVLNISISGTNLTNQQKNSIQNWCENNLGANKVVIK